MSEDLDGLVDESFDMMVDIRRSLHENPELAFAEHETTALIRTQMSSYGASELARPCETGGVFAVDGGQPGNTVILRADIDALPVQEADGPSVRSQIDGRMHACGHDVHTAVLLGVARTLSRRAEELAGRFVFLFQPAEEVLCGARTMIDGGALVGLDDARLIGCHAASILPVGYVGMRSGIMMSEAHSVRITLHGPGGHGAMPSSEGDVIGAVARLIGELAGVVEGLAYEGTACVCSAGMVRAGTAVNVVPEDAELSGTLRTFTPEQRTDAIAKLHALCDRIANEHGITAHVAFPERTPAVTNDPSVTALVREAALGVVPVDRLIAMPPVAPSDDVSEFLNRIPGCYFFVGGGKSDGTSGMHHSPKFTLDDEVLRVAAGVLTRAARSIAAEGE